MTLVVEGLSKRFGSNQAVNNLSFTLPRGEILGLLGRNGAGKTTTLKMMLDLIPKNEGSVLWEGKNFSKRNVTFGYLPEERGLYPKAKVSEQLLYFAELEGMKRKQAKEKIKEWLERFEISHYHNSTAGELSKGNQQKVQIIATILHNPDIVILDEPFSGLDPVNADLLSRIIQEEVHIGKTFILSSHRMDKIEQFCQHIIMMKAGNPVVQGTVKEIKESYGYRYLRVLPEVDQPLSSEWEKNGLYYEQKVKSDDEGLALLQEVKASGITIREFTLLEPTLHEVFVEKVR
ncbi:ABC transporter ATP-binding protein [Priestia endophytica]|uniref:ABC transporter ATP-binding protein n=1 Tax=Priestia endophytica TaxID=135735 RepID=A0AAX1Q2F1_9BACI|nr:ATP-binding cassette domain-containing protein [Priestia endophytica]RAS71721.1 ABC transporter ATP-binding protein [Priestia endophytica]RAS87247.1 ABC transporter ATP-binding protein [Priestia endophytica]